MTGHEKAVISMVAPPRGCPDLTAKSNGKPQGLPERGRQLTQLADG